MLHMSTDPLFTVKHPLRGLFMLVFVAAWVAMPLSPFLMQAGASKSKERISSPCASQADDSRLFRILVDSPLPLTDEFSYDSMFSSSGHDAKFAEDSCSINSLLSAPTGVAAVSQPAQLVTIVERSSKSVASPGSDVTKESYCVGDVTESCADVPAVVSASTGGPPGTLMALPDATRLITDDIDHASVLSGSIWLSCQFFTAIAKVGECVKATLVSTPPRTEGIFFYMFVKVLRKFMLGLLRRLPRQCVWRTCCRDLWIPLARQVNCLFSF
jgi:hypothetical protein